MKPQKILYIAATHWDREWYKTFQGFRFRLVPVIDAILDTLESDPDFSRFFLDGQTSLIEDYLEIKGENRERITALLQAGRLEAGPWFTMPDQFLVSAESLIQNLLMGHSVLKQFGVAPVKYGYSCDIFGHIANMPQILRGFNIKGALVGRGSNRHTTAMHFKWESPDGSSVIAYKLPESMGYATFWAEVIVPWDKDHNLDLAVERAIKFIDAELERANEKILLLPDGMDHQSIHPIAPAICKKLAEHYGCPVEFAGLDQLPELLADKELPVKKGELNELTRDIVEHSMLITFTLSSRYDLKKANDDCQHNLEKYAYPAAALLSLELGAGAKPVPPGYFRAAYRYLLLNHAHDSICGCSIDAVHRDMHYRFRQVQSLANGIFELYFNNENQKLKKAADGTYLLCLFNPLPYRFEKTIIAGISFDPTDSSRENRRIMYEQRNQFKLQDSSGSEIKYTVNSMHRGNPNVCTVTFTTALNPLGMTYIQVIPQNKPVRYQDRLSTGPFSAENTYLSLNMNSDGTITIKDKKNGAEYPSLHIFFDNGESGDGWFHIPPIEDRILSSLGCNKTVEKIFDGTDACSFRVTCFMPIPENLITGRIHSARSDTLTPLEISSIFTLNRSDDSISVHTIVKNTARDHRLKIFFNTGINDNQYFVSQTQALLKRVIDRGEDTHDWKESGIPEQQFEDIVFKRNSDRGLAFISAGGLHEVSADRSGGLYITLFRSFSKTVGTDGENDGQLLGDLEFRYSLLPLNSKHTNAEIERAKDRFVYGVRTFTKQNAVPIESSGCFELLSEAINFDILKSAPDSAGGLMVRFTNYSGQAAQGRFICPRILKAAAAVNFLGEVQDTPVSFKDNVLILEMKPQKMQSYLLYFNEQS